MGVWDSGKGSMYTSMGGNSLCLPSTSNVIWQRSVRIVYAIMELVSYCI